MNQPFTRTLLLCCALFTSPLFALSKTNLVLGVSGGYAKRSDNLTVTLGYSDPQAAYTSIPPSFIVVPTTDSGFIWGGLVGYQLKCDHWLVGAEINVDAEEYAKTHSFAFADASAQAGGVGFGWNGKVHYEQKIIVGLSTRVGFEIEPYLLHDYAILPYIRLGIETSKDKLETTFSGNPDVYPYSVSMNTQRWPYRYLLGIGAEFPSSAPLTFRLEYNYHSRGQVLQADGSINDGGMINPIFSSSMNPKIHSVKASIVWNI